MKSSHRPRTIKPPAEFFRLLGEQAGVWLWTFHSYRRKLNLYSDLTPVIGVHPKDLRELLDHAHPDDIEIIASELEDGVVSVRGGSFKCRLSPDARRWRHFGVTFCADRTETGVVLHGVSRDITTEVESLGAVEHARRQSELAAAFAGIGFWRDSRETDRPEWSQGMYRIHGLDPSGPALTFEEGLDRVHPDDRHILEAHRRLGADDESSGISFRIVRPDGEIRHIQTKSIIERDRTGAKIGRLGTCVDVTDVKRAESAAKQSEALYRFLADHAPDMITRLTPQGVIKYVSPSCERVFGYTPEEHIHLSPAEMCHPEDLPAVSAAIVGLFQARQRHLETPLRYRARHKDGRWIWVEANPTLILDDKGEPLEFVDIVRDVTLTKQFEADLEEARRRAEAATAAKAAFLANMSHELRTPLTSIIGFSRLMRDQKTPDPETGHFARRISEASEALMSIINDILDFSKLEAGQVNLERQPMSLRGLIEEAIRLISIQAAAKGLEIRTEIDPRLPALVMGDAARLRQVVLNLLSNAVKFTDHGSIGVKAGYSGKGRTARMRVEVSDTGPGISPEGQERLFTRFSQAEVSINRTHGGTGLGLAIGKSLIELMGGRIGVEAEVGRGSTFWFEVPAPAAKAQEALEAFEAHDGQAGEGLPLRLLVVDDTPVNRELVRLMLTRIGLQVIEAPGGAEGVQAALSEPFDLILMDLRMPGVDGLEATRVIRGTGGPNWRTPILALTADVQPESAAACRAAGMNDVIAKPISPPALISKIMQWAAGEAGAAEPAAAAALRN